ncbi:MAG: DUF4446 family protein [Lachnospiraceae bacterium]|jgi:hypothetical protein|nr:DUF4446 family protein [Lachnospiraceae bacterium]
MNGSILNNLGIDPFYIIIAQTILTIILLIVVIVCIFKIKKLYRRYDYFMRGKDAETLEDIIYNQMEDILELKSQDRANKDLIRINNKNMRASFQKFGMVKYNAFKGMGGNLSFAFALLDYTNTGFIINSVHSREGCYLYLKEVDRGQTEISLGSEEKNALEQALGYRE